MAEIPGVALPQAVSRAGMLFLGPFKTADASYAVYRDSTSQTTIKMMSGPESGTWAEVGSATRPVSSSPVGHMDAVMQGNLIHVSSQHNDGTVKYHRFSTVSDNWEVVNEAVASPTNRTFLSGAEQNREDTAIAVRSNGDVVIAYQSSASSQGNRWGAVAYNIRTGGSWGTPGVVYSDAGTHNVYPSSIAQVSDRVHFIMTQITSQSAIRPLAVRTLSAGNVLSGTNTTTDWFSEAAKKVGVSDGGNVFVPNAYEYVEFTSNDNSSPGAVNRWAHFRHGVSGNGASPIGLYAEGSQKRVLCRAPLVTSTANRVTSARLDSNNLWFFQLQQNESAIHTGLHGAGVTVSGGVPTYHYLVKRDDNTFHYLVSTEQFFQSPVRAGSDIQGGGWYTNGGSQSNLWAQIDETVPNAGTDYVRPAAPGFGIPAGSTSGEYIFSVGNLDSISADTNHWIEVQLFASDDAVSNSTGVGMNLYQGSTLIHATGASVFAEGSWDRRCIYIPGSDVANITDYSALRVGLVYDNTGFTSTGDIYVSWVGLRAPIQSSTVNSVTRLSVVAGGTGT